MAKRKAGHFIDIEKYAEVASTHPELLGHVLNDMKHVAQHLAAASERLEDTIRVIEDLGSPASRKRDRKLVSGGTSARGNRGRKAH